MDATSETAWMMDMTLLNLLALLENSFRNYANFSRRAGRAKFWLFLLCLFLATNLAWIIRYGGMMLVSSGGERQIFVN